MKLTKQGIVDPPTRLMTTSSPIRLLPGLQCINSLLHANFRLKGQKTFVLKFPQTKTSNNTQKLTNQIIKPRIKPQGFNGSADSQKVT